MNYQKQAIYNAMTEAEFAVIEEVHLDPRQVTDTEMLNQITSHLLAKDNKRNRLVLAAVLIISRLNQMEACHG